MPDELTNPLRALLAGAAKRLPADTGEAARHKARFAASGDATVLLLDCSGSMAGSAGAATKIALLRQAVADVLPGIARPSLLAFASSVTEVSGPASIPEPSGGTALHLGLDAAADRRPARTLVVSDGQPDDQGAALAAAARCPGRIDVLYCGPDGDAAAKDFLRRLASAGSGSFVARDVRAGGRPALGNAMRQLLALEDRR